MRLHFTVSPEHRGRFEALLEAIRPVHRRRYGGRLEVGFSVQKPSTDTLAADLDGQPFRTAAASFCSAPAATAP